MLLQSCLPLGFISFCLSFLYSACAATHPSWWKSIYLCRWWVGPNSDCTCGGSGRAQLSPEKKRKKQKRRKKKRKRTENLQSTAVGGEEEGNRKREEALYEQEILLPQAFRPLPRIKAHQLLHCQLESYLPIQIKSENFPLSLEKQSRTGKQSREEEEEGGRLPAFLVSSWR